MSGPLNPKQAAYAREYRRRKKDMVNRYIYILCDPRNCKIRYVGSTWDVNRRHTEHCNPTQCTYKKRLKWLEELWAEGVNPVLVVIEETIPELRLDREQYWIDKLTKAGADLLIGRSPAKGSG